MRNRSTVCAGVHRSRWVARLTGSLTLLLCVAAGGAAYAGPKDFMIFTPGLGGDAEQAKPYIDRFGQLLDKQLGWPAGSAKGTFYSSRKEALAGITPQKPGFGVMEASLYLEMRAAHKAEVLAQVDSEDLNSPRLHVVVKNPAYKSLADLAGKKLWTTLADSPKYLGNVVLDSKGIVQSGRSDLNSFKAELAGRTNPRGLTGGVAEALDGADVFLGVSAGLVPEELIATMAPGSIVFALSNPDPEIHPDAARKYAAVVATGRSDFPNQINNVLAFPGVFRGALDAGARRITEEMKVAAAHAIFSVVGDDLSVDYIVPSALDPRVGPAVAAAVWDSPPYWAFCWPGGGWLSQWLPQQESPGTVVDLGRAASQRVPCRRIGRPRSIAGRRPELLEGVD